MPQQVSITIDVSDLTNALEFYMQALSCELKNKHSDDWAVISIGGVHINLLERKTGTVAAAEHKRSYERHWTPVHLDFSVESVSATIDLVKQYGGSIDGHVPSEGSKLAHCADPFGNGFCLVGT